MAAAIGEKRRNDGTSLRRDGSNQKRMTVVLEPVSKRGSEELRALNVKRKSFYYLSLLLKIADPTMKGRGGARREG